MPQRRSIKQDPEETSYDNIHSSTGQRLDMKSYSFSEADERHLVDFFRENDCFYNRYSTGFSDTRHKNKLLQDIGAQLSCEPSKILGWFKNQRTAMGKILKKRTCQAGLPLSSRSRWQLASFAFLRDHIHARTYTPDTRDADSHPEDAAPIQCQVPKPQKTLRDIVDDEMPLPHSTEPYPMVHMFLNEGSMEEREAFIQLIRSQVRKIPHHRWDDFTDECFMLVRSFTRGGLNSIEQPTNQNPTQWNFQENQPLQFQQNKTQNLQQTLSKPTQQKKSRKCCNQAVAANGGPLDTGKSTQQMLQGQAQKSNKSPRKCEKYISRRCRKSSPSRCSRSQSVIKGASVIGSFETMDELDLEDPEEKWAIEPVYNTEYMEC